MTFKHLLLAVLVLPFLGCSSLPYNVNINNVIKTHTMYSHKLPTMYKSKSLLTINNNKQLEVYLREVIQNNNDLNALALTKKSLALDMKITRANMYPSGGFSLAYSKSKEDLNTQGNSRVSSELTMNWDLDLWGKLSDEYASSRETYLSMKYQYLEQKRILLLNATIDWINYWYLVQVIENQKVLLDKYKNLTRHYLETSNAGLKDRYFYLLVNSILQD